MFGGIGSSTGTNFSSSTYTTSRREDKLEEETPVLNETPIYTTPTTTTTSTSTHSSSRSLVHVPPELLAFSPKLKSLYEIHVYLFTQVETLRKLVDNVKRLNELEQSAMDESSTDQRTQQASAPVFKKPDVPQTTVPVTGVSAPLATIAPVPQISSLLSLLNPVSSYSQIQVPPLCMSDLSVYALNSSPLSAPTQNTIQNLCQPLLVQAKTFEAQGQVEQAELIYLQMIQSGYCNAQVLGNYGQFLNGRKKFIEAELYLQSAMQMQPTLEIRKDYSYCLLQLNKKMEAKKQIEIVLAAMPPGDPAYLFCLQIWNETST